MKKKRAGWSRWAKTVRNFLLALLLGLVVWNQLGTPLPYTAALRRAERQQLLPKMDHRVDVRGYFHGSIRFEWTEGAAVISAPHIPTDTRLQYFYVPFTTPQRLTEGVNLLTSSRAVATPPGERAKLPGVYTVYAAVFPPEDSVTAELTLHIRNRAYTSSAQREGDAFIFYAQPEPSENGIRVMGPEWYSPEKFTYELAFYDADHTLIQEAAK